MSSQEERSKFKCTTFVPCKTLPVVLHTRGKKFSREIFGYSIFHNLEACNLEKLVTVNYRLPGCRVCLHIPFPN